MLGKLTKNSFKANASSVYNIYIAMGIIGVIMLVLLLVDWTKWGDTGIGVGLLIKILASGALCITAAIGVIMTFVSVFSDFSRSMYGAEGHLTLTLPVRSSTLLLSKWLAGSFWVVLAYVVLCLCGFGSFIYCIKHSISIVEGNEAYYSVYELVTQMANQIFASSGISTPSMGVILNLAGIYAFSGGVRACVFVLLVYFAITISHCRTFNKAGKLGRVLYFFGIFFIVNTFSAIVTKLVKIYVVISDAAFTFTLSESEVAAAWKSGFGAYSITNLYCTAIAAVFIFLVTCVLIDSRVNAD